MAIRKYDTPRAVDLSPGLQEVLRRNGIQAHISVGRNGGLELIVLGHDSPVLSYRLNDRQVQNLMGWGSTFENKKAYNTFTSIVRNDFQMPDNYVSASNAFGKVAMGLHGYRPGHNEYSYSTGYPRLPWFQPFHRNSRGWAGDFVGFAPRHEGFHLRRIPTGGTVIPERPDGRLKPGEMRSGGYGFYYKGHQQETAVDVLDHLAIDPMIKPLETAPRTHGKGIPISETINMESDVTHVFTTDTFLEVMASHGIVVDTGKKTLTIQSGLSKVDLQYDLKPEELQTIIAPDLKGQNGVSLDERLAVINDVIGKDFAAPVTKEMLETKELVSIDLRPEVREELEAPFIEQEQRIAAQQRLAAAREEERREAEKIARDPNAISGRDIQAVMGNKGWFQPVAHGREMVVNEIRVDRIRPGTFVMTAEINGRLVTHAITEKDYNRFLELDDKHRLKLFDDIFKEVEIRAHGHSISAEEMYRTHDAQTVMRQKEADIIHATSDKVDGTTLQEYNEKKGFYRERAHGREVEVGNIQVEPMKDGRYRMTAIIEGQAISHEITQKQYDKFLAVDDYHRMQLFSKIFSEVDIKTRPGQRTDISAALLAALVVTGEMTTEGIGRQQRQRPEMYETKMPPTVYAKEGVVSIADIAAANFRSQEANIRPAPEEHIGRGL